MSGRPLQRRWANLRPVMQMQTVAVVASTSGAAASAAAAQRAPSLIFEPRLIRAIALWLAHSTVPRDVFIARSRFARSS